MIETYSSIETWKNDFMKVGGMRGVGWAILFQDPMTKVLSNHWISSHEEGNVAGFVPILVMDVWEHAFLLDYKPSERSKYIEAFFANIDWAAVEGRLLK
jgi:Fe-Mn family superoxide dismutase